MGGQPLAGTHRYTNPKFDMNNDEKKQVIINSLSAGLNVNTACACAGVNRVWIYHRMKEDPEFKLRVEQAKANSTYALAREVQRRALVGSDKLLMYWLDRQSPEFQTGTNLSSEELETLERVINLMVDNGLLPKAIDAAFEVLPSDEPSTQLLKLNQND